MNIVFLKRFLKRFKKDLKKILKDEIGFINDEMMKLIYLLMFIRLSIEQEC
jgi:mRNA-degrading endonuclease YafQ of YafQ-DinJ toxin-antitoxin module